MKNKIDVSTEEKRKEIYDIFDSLTSKNKIHEYFNISDNKSGSEYIKQIANEIGFDLNVYKERKKRFCLNCGKELKKGQNKFCSSSCAASFNNKKRGKRSEETKKKISESLKSKYEPNRCIICGNIIDNRNKKYCSDECKNKKIREKSLKKEKKYSSTKIKNICLECGKEYIGCKGTNFCSNECSSKYRHKELYKDFLENNEKYCRANYSPKAFKKDILIEQGGVCAICGNPPIWNDKSLVFIIDHIDGNSANNRRENLRCICPNCDSQLDTFKSKNKNSARRKYWREKTISILKEKIENGDINIDNL